MADIELVELVIKIPKTDYRCIKEIPLSSMFGFDNWKLIAQAIANGTPLPKCHGRLIILSEDVVKREQTPLSFSCQNWISEVDISNATVAIIEADKAESELKE